MQSRRKILNWLGLGGVAAAPIAAASIAKASPAALPMWVEQTADDTWALIIKCSDGKDRVAFGWTYFDDEPFVPDPKNPKTYPLMIGWGGPYSNAQ